jgi:protein SCO1
MNGDNMKTTVLLVAAGIAGGVLLTPVWAHEGHDHGVQAQRGGEPRGHDDQTRASQPEVTFGNYERSLQVYAVPDVTLVNANARPIRIRELLMVDGPVMLDFISTTCTTNCPALSRELSTVPAKLGAAAARLRMMSVSIDPETDTPAQLQAYARQLGAGPNWQFFTGSREDIETVQRAFDINHDHKLNKLDTEPLTFLRAAPGKPWVRINGFASAEDLAREYRNVVPN